MALTQVKTAGIAADAVTGAKVADDQIDSEHYIAASIDNEHLANNAVDSDELAAGSVDIAHLATGTDGQIITWGADGAATAVGPGTDGQVLTSTGAGSAPAFETISTGGGLPCFFASANSTIDLAANSWIKLELSTEEVDSASAYDHSTNYRFTPQTAGYYYVWSGYTCRFQTAAHWMYIAIYKNGSNAFQNQSINGRNSDYDNWAIVDLSGIVSLNGSSDYIEVYVKNSPDSGTTTIPIVKRHFGAFRIGDN